MAADESRAQRIRDLKKPFGREITWREIANFVGVAERSTYDWARTGAMEKANAFKLAEFFRRLGVDIAPDYIWRGPLPEAPKLTPAMNDQDGSLEDLYSKVDEIQQTVARIEDYLREQASEQVRQRVARAAEQRSKRPDTKPEDRRAEGA